MRARSRRLGSHLVDLSHCHTARHSLSVEIVASRGALEERASKEVRAQSPVRHDLSPRRLLRPSPPKEQTACICLHRLRRRRGSAARRMASSASPTREHSRRNELGGKVEREAGSEGLPAGRRLSAARAPNTSLRGCGEVGVVRYVVRHWWASVGVGGRGRDCR